MAICRPEWRAILGVSREACDTCGATAWLPPALADAHVVLCMECGIRDYAVQPELIFPRWGIPPSSN